MIRSPKSRLTGGNRTTKGPAIESAVVAYREVWLDR